MNSTILMALIATLGTWFITALGAATVIFFKKTSDKVMNLMLGFAAGVMIAASFWSLLQPAIERAETYLSVPAWLVVSCGFIFGALFMWASDKAVTYAGRLNAKTSSSCSERLNRIILLVFSITLHNIPEGLAVGVAFGALNNGGFTTEAFMGAITIAVGIGLQNFPEGAAVSLPLKKEGLSNGKSFALGALSGVVEPVAGIIGVLLAGSITGVMPWILSFAAGAMIYVVVEELIPEAHLGEHSHSGTLGVIAGFVIMMVLDTALG